MKILCAALVRHILVADREGFGPWVSRRKESGRRGQAKNHRRYRGGPRVRIQLPPAGGQLRTGLPPLPKKCCPLRGDRGFESVSLQRGVRSEFGLARLGTRPLTDAEYDHERAVASPRRPIYVRERGRTRKGSRCKTSAKPWWFGSRDW